MVSLESKAQPGQLSKPPNRQPSLSWKTPIMPRQDGLISVIQLPKAAKICGVLAKCSFFTLVFTLVIRRD